MKRLALVLPLTLAATLPVACRSVETVASPDEFAPTPFTADEIRLACSPGTTIAYRVERAGQEDVMQHMRFMSGDPSGTVVQTHTTSMDGVALGDGSVDRSTWEELRDHAAFPSARTVRTEERIEVPAGEFNCWRYEVHGDPSDSTVTRYWFARTLPGPPVLLEQEHNGSIDYRMVLVLRQGPE